METLQPITSIVENKEKTQKYTLERYLYRTPVEASLVWVSLSDVTKQEMADVYRKAFGGPPWYENFLCKNDGTYNATDLCSQCGLTGLDEAYPTEELLSETIPSMMHTFEPGVLILAKNDEGKCIGFSTGGKTTIDTLVKKKYGNNKEIKSSLLVSTGIGSRRSIFYDNETCIDPELQREGLGRILSQVRIDAAIELNATAICGRTINIPWLQVKEQQLSNAGYSFKTFVPDGDTYSVDGKSRYFYIATMSTRRVKNE